MNKISIGVACLILAFIFGNTVIVSGQGEDGEMCIPMGSILLEPPESVEAKRPPVNFPHATHFGFQCQTCHHAWEVDVPVVSCTTSDCHDGVISPTKAKREGTGEDLQELAVSYYKSAFHKMCISCHKEMKIQNKKLEIIVLMLLLTKISNIMYLLKTIWVLILPFS